MLVWGIAPRAPNIRACRVPNATQRDGRGGSRFSGRSPDRRAARSAARVRRDRRVRGHHRRWSLEPRAAGMGGGGPVRPRTAEERERIPMAVDLAVGAASGFCAAFCAAPLIMTVDKAVTEKAAGRASLPDALRSGLTALVRNPLHIIKGVPFWMVCDGSTYLTANSIDTLCERGLDQDDESSTWLHGAAKLFGTTAVNMSTGVAKDAAFARMFGAGGPAPPPVPRVTLGLFAARDVFTIGAAFTIPPLAAQALAASGAVDPAKAPDVAQLASPIAMQAVLTPLHLLALNLYNAPAATPRERAASVAAMSPGATLARMGRFGAAYGLGGVLNAKLTLRGREWAAAAYAAKSAEPTGECVPLLRESSGSGLASKAAA